MATKIKMLHEMLEESDFKELMKHKKEILNFIKKIETLQLVAVNISNCYGTCNYLFTDAYVEYTRTGACVFYKTLFEIEVIKHFIESGVLSDELHGGGSVTRRMEFL
jgi:hypothetical protein